MVVGGGRQLQRAAPDGEAVLAHPGAIVEVGRHARRGGLSIATPVETKRPRARVA